MIIKQPAIIKINNRRKYINCNIETMDDILIGIETSEIPLSKRDFKFLMKIVVPSQVKFRIVTGTKVYNGVGFFSNKNMKCAFNEFEFNFEISNFKYVNCKEARLREKAEKQFNMLDMFKNAWYNEMTKRMDEQILRG